MSCRTCWRVFFGRKEKGGMSLLLSIPTWFTERGKRGESTHSSGLAFVWACVDGVSVCYRVALVTHTLTMYHLIPSPKCVAPFAMNRDDTYVSHAIFFPRNVLSIIIDLIIPATCLVSCCRLRGSAQMYRRHLSLRGKVVRRVEMKRCALDVT